MPWFQGGGGLRAIPLCAPTVSPQLWAARPQGGDAAICGVRLLPIVEPATTHWGQAAARSRGVL